MNIALILMSFACRQSDKIDTDIITDNATIDADGDGFNIDDGDCDDNNAEVYPEKEELCDGLDNNCNDDIDEGVTTDFYQDYG